MRSAISLGAIAVFLHVGLIGTPISAGTVTFDEVVLTFPFARVPVLSSRYQAEGIILATDGAGMFISNDASHTPTNGLFAASITSGTGVNADSDIIVSFVVPGTNIPAVTDQLSFYVVDAFAGNGSVWTATVFNVDGHQIDLLSSTERTRRVDFMHSGIHQLVFSPSSDYEFFDTLEFGELVAVPEPSVLVLTAIAYIFFIKSGSGHLRRLGS